MTFSAQLDNALTELRAIPRSQDLAKHVQTQYAYGAMTPAQRKALKTPGVASPKASTYRAKGARDFTKVHPSKLGYGAIVMFRGKHHTVVGKKGKKTELRDPKGKIISVDLAMGGEYEGVVGRGEETETDVWDMLGS